MNLPFLLLRSLKTRLTVFTLVIFVLGIWSLSLYVGRSLQDDMEHLLGEQQFTVITSVAKSVNDDLTDRLQALETVAKEVDAGLLARPATLQARLEQRPLLQLLFNGGVFVAGPDGTAIADVPLSTGRIGTNYMDWDSVSISLKEGKTVIGQPVMGKKLGAPVFSMVAPIRDTQGKVIGSLVAIVNLGKPSFLDKITQSAYGKSGGYFLIDLQHRMVVTATDKSRVMKALPAPGINPLIDRFISGYEGYAVLVNAVGVGVLSSSKVIPVAGWAISASLPTAEAFAPIAGMQQRLLWATLLLTVLTGALSWLVLRRQLAPLLATADAMTALANSKGIPQPLLATQHGEIGQLVAGFNRILETWAQREAALTDSQQNLAITLHSIGDAVIATDTAGRITRMNPVAERLTGWALADALGQPLTKVFHVISAETRLPSVNPVQLVMERGEVVGLANHTALLARDGQEYQIADSAAPIRDATNAIVGVVLVFSDVTKKYRADAALHNSEETFRTLATVAPIGIYLTDPKGDCLYANTRWCEMAGMEMTAALGQGWVQGLHPDDRAGVFANWKQMVDSEGSWGVEYRFQTPDNKVTWVYALAVPQRTDGGEIIKYIGINLDITQRKQAEQDMALNRALIEAVVDGSPSLIYAMSIDGRFLLVNRAFEQLFGRSRSELLGRTRAEGLGGLMPPEIAEEHFQNDMKVAAGDCAYEVEEENEQADGHHVYVTQKHPLHDAKGHVFGVAGMSTDITARKQMEVALQSSVNEKSALLKEVHHRVKNNLQVITSLLRLESRRSTVEDTKAVLGDMQARIRAMALLHESLYRSGTFASVDLGSYLRQLATQAFQTQSTNAGAVQLALNMGSVPVGMDQAIPCGLLINELISNCLKHGFPAGVTGQVSIELQPLDTPDQWRLCVSDNGLGLPENFEDKRKNSLGLQLVGDLARQIGGELKITANPDKGVAFTVIFRAIEPAPLVMPA
jgi:PAS domain S-box-containing protein